MTDGTLFAALPFDDSEFVHIADCIVTSTAIYAFATDGVDTEFIYYEFDVGTWESEVVEDYLAIGYYYKAEANDVLVLAVDTDGDDAFIYFNVNNGIQAMAADTCVNCFFIDSTHVFADVSDNWNYIDVTEDPLAPIDTGVAYADANTVWAAPGDSTLYYVNASS
jgi:hypothetical protein